METRGRVTFSRAELGRILDVYAAQVAAGEWRDYAIDHLQGMAVFSIFRHTLETPKFRVVKFRPLGAKRNYEFAVYQGQTLLRRAGEIENAMRILERKLKLVKG
jgi:hypothetical protein